MSGSSARLGRLPAGIRPVPLSGAAAALAALTTSLILLRHPTAAGVAALAASAALLAASLGSRGARSKLARFVELVLDRLLEASILVPLAWVTRAGSNGDSILALVGLGASYVAAYERARGESLGYRGSETLGYRLSREAILVLGLLTGLIEASLWLFATLTVISAAVRAWNVMLQDRPRAGEETLP